jgi:hypothetical protein
MGYRRSYSNRRSNNYAVDGGYDSTGRWRSEAWHMDGGANDEGWHQAYCSYCGKETEHGRGSGCVPCENRIVASRVSRKNKVKLPKDTHEKAMVRLDRMAVIRIYENNAGNLPSFLESLDTQLGKNRDLTPKQVKVAAKIFSNIVDQDVIDRVWSRTLPRNASEEMKVGSIVRLESACDPRTVTDKNCPWSRYNNEFEIKSLKNPDDSGSWTSDTKSYVVIK